MAKINKGPIAESLLYHIWDEGHLRMDELKTADGQRIEVLFKGKWNVDTGPDFKGAVIRFGDEIVKGDVEIHTDVADWQNHNHHLDPIYNTVVLHAVMWGTEGQQVVKENGSRVPLLILADFLDESIERLQKRVENLRTGLKSCLLSACGETEIVNVIERWGDRRLKTKVERFREELNQCSWDQLLYQGMMEALGYSKNQRPFLKLAKLLPVEVLFREIRNESGATAIEKSQALLFGAAGLLPTEEEKLTFEREFVDRLRVCWRLLKEKLHLQSLRPEEWQFFRLRPGNFPTRRLAGMSYLSVRFAEEGFLSSLRRIFKGLARRPDAIIAELERILTCEAEGYWKSHYRFDDEKAVATPPSSATLIGRERARDTVVNVVIPIFLLYAEQTDDGQLESVLRNVYNRYPKLADNFITHSMARQLAGESRKGQEFISTAKRQQGVIHIYKLLCKEKRCHECVDPEIT